MTPTVVLRTAAPEEIRFDETEAERYLGARGQAVADLRALLASAGDELRRVVTPRACFVRLPLTVQGTLVDCGAFSLSSRDLSKNLSGCTAVIVFAATLGAAADRCILKYEKTRPSRAMVLDAVASSMAECWCDTLNAELTVGLESRPRFSPGYGDVPLTLQKEILALLDAQRKLGITLSDTCFMTPTKTVTAFIGLKGETPR